MESSSLRALALTWLVAMTILLPVVPTYGESSDEWSKQAGKMSHRLKNDRDDYNNNVDLGVAGIAGGHRRHGNRAKAEATFDETERERSRGGEVPTFESETRHSPRFLINQWSQSIHDAIVNVATKATSISDIQTDYLMSSSSLREVDGLKLVYQYKERLEKMLKRKTDALEKIVRKAEESYAQFVQTGEVQTNYPKAKNLSSDFELNEESDRDFAVPVNKYNSTVHVPTNVFDESSPILHGVAWSKPLDEVFARNYEADSGLSWQFFASSAGFLRIFPGINWPKQPDDIDLHDSRLEPWYIRAANSPKDAVILIDSSGSMRGLRREIARTTVEKIVQTFGVDDYFNVIKFSDVVEYLEPCRNGSLIQGTTSNKQAVIEALKTGMKTANMANYVLAFNEAFELLNKEPRSNLNHVGSACNKLVMLVTDGVTEKYEPLFQKFQEKWPNSNVRIFTYLIGREVADAEKVKWIACHNKGYHSHISTMADVHEHIQEYIHVVSRPMVMSRADHVVWTTNHLNILKDKATITLSRAVYDVREKMFTSGSLIGVAAIDIPSSEITRQIPIQELGAGGYAFLVTNNGHVLLHPKLKLQMTELQDIKTVDISNIEFDDVEIRKQIIEREPGLVQLKTKFTSLDNKRVFVQNRWYAFAPIADTSFSLCLSLPANPIVQLVEENVLNENHDFILDFRASHFKLAPWFYCKLRSNLQPSSPVLSHAPFHVSGQQLSHEEELLLQIATHRHNASFTWDSYANKCNVHLLRQLLFDTMATRSVVSNWQKSDNIHGSNQKLSERYGIESLFLMTRSGLTRYYHFQTNHTEPAYLEFDTSPSTNDHYQRTSFLEEGTFVFSAPFSRGHQAFFYDPLALHSPPNSPTNPHHPHHPHHAMANDPDRTLITASSAIFVSSDANTAMVGMVSLQMRLSRFNDLFLVALSVQSENCKKDGHKEETCNVSCLDSEVLHCYLIDESGFIVASQSPGQDVGKFFSDVKNLQSIADDLIYDKDDKGFEKGIFKEHSVFDYQDVCEIWKVVASAANISGFQTLGELLKILLSFLENFVNFLRQVPVIFWCITTGIAEGMDDSQYPYFMLDGFSFDTNSTDTPDYFKTFDQSMITSHLEFLANNNSELLDSWMNELRKMIFDKKSDMEILEWFKEKDEQYRPQAIGSRPCVKNYNLYKAQFQVLPYSGVSETCLEMYSCRRLFSAAHVPRTNLILLAVDGSCDCEVYTRVSVEPKEIIEESCSTQSSTLFRKRPLDCFSSHEGEDSLKCGVVRPTSDLVIKIQPVLAILLWRTSWWS